MNKSGHRGLGLYTIGIAALFLAGFFLLVVFGAQIYRNTVSSQNENNRSRALLSYLATTVKAYDAKLVLQDDTKDALTVEEDAEYGKVLVLREGSSGYALRIFQANGSLMEEYARLDSPLSLENAQVLGETGVFEPELEDGLLTVRCDAGKVLLHLRAGAWEAVA